MVELQLDTQITKSLLIKLEAELSETKQRVAVQDEQISLLRAENSSQKELIDILMEMK